MTGTGLLLAGQHGGELVAELPWEGREGETKGWREWQSGQCLMGTLPHADRGPRKKAKGAIFMKILKTFWVQTQLFPAHPQNMRDAILLLLHGTQYRSCIPWDGDFSCSKRHYLPLTPNSILHRAQLAGASQKATAE